MVRKALGGTDEDPEIDLYLFESTFRKGSIVMWIVESTFYHTYLIYNLRHNLNLLKLELLTFKASKTEFDFDY